MRRSSAIILSLFILLSLSPVASAQSTAPEAYASAKACYSQIKSDAVKSGNRKEWEKCIDMFEKVNAAFPSSQGGIDALFSAAKLRRELYFKFHDLPDAEAAIKVYNQLVREYPKSSLADDALYQIAVLRRKPLGQDDKSRDALVYLLETYPKGDMAPEAKKLLASVGGAQKKEMSVEHASQGEAKADVSDVEAAEPSAKSADGARFGADVAGPFAGAILNSIDVDEKDESTTIELKFNKPVAYSIEFTDQGLRTRSSPTLDLTLSYARPSDALAKELTIGSSYLNKIKLRKRLLGSGSKLTFVMTPGSTYDVIPKGSVIALSFRRSDGAPPSKSAAVETAVPDVKESKKKLTVVIDPGHGGDEAGAIGPGSTKEKDIALEISKALAESLKGQMGVDAYLTRTKDKTLTLDQRDEFAIKKKADIFISIHANAAKGREMSGIETYYLNNATDKAAAKLAARENQASGRKMSDVEHILSTMLQNYDAAESRKLAIAVQDSLMKRMGKKYPGVKNRKVRSALFYVLVGAKCPAILVETSFISNPREESRLKNHTYQENLATAISDGVSRYVKMQSSSL